jgi:hypothetical protein
VLAQHGSLVAVLPVTSGDNQLVMRRCHVNHIILLDLISPQEGKPCVPPVQTTGRMGAYRPGETRTLTCNDMSTSWPALPGKDGEHNLRRSFQCACRDVLSPQACDARSSPDGLITKVGPLAHPQGAKQGSWGPKQTGKTTNRKLQTQTTVNSANSSFQSSSLLLPAHLLVGCWCRGCCRSWQAGPARATACLQQHRAIDCGCTLGGWDVYTMPRHWLPLPMIPIQ